MVTLKKGTYIDIHPVGWNNHYVMNIAAEYDIEFVDGDRIEGTVLSGFIYRYKKPYPIHHDRQIDHIRWFN